MSRVLARLVGLTFISIGIWVFVINLMRISYSGWSLAWVLAAGALGATGGLLYLLSFSGSPRFGTARIRLAGWIGMLVLALLPTSIMFPLLAMLLATAPTLLMPFREEGTDTVSKA